MSRRQRYSNYLPLNRPSRTTSRATSLAKDGGSRTRKMSPGLAARNAASAASKRRSTLNSREAGYDEDELLRRAIEASKEDALPETTEAGAKRHKRGRSDSEESVPIPAIRLGRELTWCTETNPVSRGNERAPGPPLLLCETRSTWSGTMIRTTAETREAQPRRSRGAPRDRREKGRNERSESARDRRQPISGGSGRIADELMVLPQQFW